MLTWIRRYQRYIYLFVTFIIIISFSFFGTYSAFPSPYSADEVSFIALGGRKIKRSELEAMTRFLATDAEEKTLYGGIWGPNFLNDGVIKKDFLQTGLAAILFASFDEALAPDIERKHGKEKHYKTYTHPQAPFLTAEKVWSVIAPQLYQKFHEVKQRDEGSSDEAISNRIELFLAEREFPAPALRKVLRYQEQQYRWITPDPHLEAADLSLFGYHTIEDWFGPRFLKLVSAFIINAAQQAKERGYSVSDAEAWADLVENAEASFHQNRSRSSLGFSNASLYLQEQLRRMGIDKTLATKLWQQVLLFRRLFHDYGNMTLVDPLPFEQFHGFAREYVDVERYRLPESLTLSDFRQLQHFSTYVEAITPSSWQAKETLSLPQEFLSIDEIEKKAPELVQRKYLLEIASVNKNQAAAGVSIKETWEWEVNPEHFDRLQAEFPELAGKAPRSHSERFAVLEGLDRATRARVDRFARQAILDENPERVRRALREAEREEMEIYVRGEGGNLPIQGLKRNPAARTRLLDWLTQVPPGDTEAYSAEEKKAQEGLAFFTADQQAYYTIRVVQRDEKKSVVPFAEADDILEEMTLEKLEGYYEKVRENTPSSFQTKEGKWKELRDVRSTLAKQYWKGQIDALHKVAPQPKNGKEWNLDELAKFRFWSRMNEAKRDIMQDPANAQKWIRSEQEGGEVSLGDQWRLIKERVRMDRTSATDELPPADVFSYATGEWSAVESTPRGFLHFFHVKGKGVGEPNEMTIEQTGMMHRLLSAEAQRTLMQSLLPLMETKNAFPHV